MREYKLHFDDAALNEGTHRTSNHSVLWKLFVETFWLRLRGIDVEVEGIGAKE